MIGRRAAPALLAALCCGVPDPEPLARITAASPTGTGVPVGAPAELRFSAPVRPDGLLDGVRLVLAEAASLRDAVAAVESDAGAAGAWVAARAAIDDGGRRVVLRPLAALRPFTEYAIVLSSLVRAADGRPVLDPEGRVRTFVARYTTGAPEGPPAEPALTELRADAEAPEAGGEYVEVANLGAGPLHLSGFRLAKRTEAGGLASCAIAANAAAPVDPGAVAIVAGGAWDGRYALPYGVPVLACGTSALLGGIANDRAPELLLADPSGAVVATLGAGGAPRCPIALERVAPRGADEPANLACTDGSPGVLP